MEGRQAKHVYTREAARQLIENALKSLEGLQAVLGEKKFNRRIKKASKLFTSGLPKSKTKKKGKTKQNVEEAA